MPLPWSTSTAPLPQLELKLADATTLLTTREMELKTASQKVDELKAALAAYEREQSEERRSAEAEQTKLQWKLQWARQSLRSIWSSLFETVDVPPAAQQQLLAAEGGEELLSAGREVVRAVGATLAQRIDAVREAERVRRESEVDEWAEKFRQA